MKLNFRKLLIIGIIILGIIVLILGVWILFFGGEKDSQENNPIDIENSNLENESSVSDFNQLESDIQSQTRADEFNQKIEEIKLSEQINVLSDRPVIGITLNKTGDRVVYYDRETGQVFRISFDGKIWERVSDIENDNIQSVQWSLYGSKSIVKNQRGETIDNYIYDSQNGQIYDLDDKIGSIVFSPDGRRILYHFWDSYNKSNIAIANYDGSNWEELFKSSMTGLKLYWPKLDTVAFLSPGGDFYGADLYFTKLDPPYQLDKILDDKFDLQVNWAPSGIRLLYSYKTKKESSRRRFYLRDYDKKTDTSLSFNALPENCVWNKEETALYCAEKTTNFTDIIPDDYQKKLSLESDSFWKIDFQAQEFQEIYIPKQEEEKIYNIGELIVSDNEDYLFFINKLDGKLYSLRI